MAVIQFYYSFTEISTMEFSNNFCIQVEDVMGGNENDGIDDE